MVWVVGGEYKWEDLEGFLRLSTAQGYFSQAGRNPIQPLLTGPCVLVEKQGRTKEVPFSNGKGSLHKDISAKWVETQPTLYSLDHVPWWRSRAEPRRYLSLTGKNTPCGLAVVPQTLLGQVLDFMGNH